MKTTRIRIPAFYRDKNGTKVHHIADFQLGLGPCGKVVTCLSLDQEDDVVRVIQCHDDSTAKVFSYLKAHITGRIEVEMGPLH